MPFPYYDNLSAAKKRIYTKSASIEHIPLKRPDDLHPLVMELKKSLEGNKRSDVARLASGICRMICDELEVEALAVKISSRRPSNSNEELQGLYEREEGERPVLTVWMRTAAKGQVVAFKSFIRTVIHELCHHIDYTYYKLDDSLHTEGFFKRESSLYREIVPPELQKKAPRKKKTAAGRKKVIRKKRLEPRQLEPKQMKLL